MPPTRLHMAVAYCMWVCSTATARGCRRWMGAWMQKAVRSTVLPLLDSTGCRHAVANHQAGHADLGPEIALGLISIRSGRPGTATLKWLQTPVCSSNRAAHRQAAASSTLVRLHGRIVEGLVGYPSRHSSSVRRTGYARPGLFHQILLDDRRIGLHAQPGFRGRWA